MKNLLYIALALTTAIANSARGADDPLAASIDLNGLVLQHDSNIKQTSDGDLIEANTTYDYVISGTVTGSGAFGFIKPGTDIHEALDQIQPGFSENLDGSVINPSGKLPFTVLSKKLSGSFDAGPIPANAKATVKAGISPGGEPFFSVTRVSFTVFGGVPVNGKITFDPGSMCNVLIPPASNLPQRPDLLFSIPKQEAFGNNVYANETITLMVAKRHAARSYLLMQNDGTLTDSFTLQGPAGNDDIELSYFSGKTNVTEQVVGGTFTASDVPSRGGAVLKLKVKVKKADGKVEGDLTLRSSVPAITDVIHFIVEGG